MNAYIYQAALLCEECAERFMDTHNRLTDSEYSDDWPQGPYSDGGGEADCPQHCDHCGTFLENPLTTDGMDYIREQVENSAPGSVALTVWAPFYGIELPEEAA